MENRPTPLEERLEDVDSLGDNELKFLIKDMEKDRQKLLERNKGIIKKLKNYKLTVKQLNIGILRLHNQEMGYRHSSNYWNSEFKKLNNDS